MAPLNGKNRTVAEQDKLTIDWLKTVSPDWAQFTEREDGSLILLDEAWKLLDDGYFEARLKDWMLTMRKKNVALVMLTQRVSHVAESRAGGSILESIATTLVFPSSRFTAAELAPLGLSDAETAFLTQSPGGRRFAAIRTGDHGALVDLDLAALGPLLAVLGGGASREGDA